MMKSRRWRRWVIPPLVAVGLLVGLPASPALANSGCGFVCDGKDPSTFRVYVGPGQYDWYYCGTDALTARSVQIPYTLLAVELRYSPRCRTAWARTHSSAYIYVERLSPYRLEYAYPSSLDSYPINRFTRMVNDAGYVSRACIEQPYGGTFCTDWY